jgi:hypothetical protein
MTHKLPREAFEFYLELGVDRSYRAVAEHFGVTKVAVVNRARTERWQERLRNLERQSRERSERKTLDEMDAVRERQLKAARYVQSRALEAMRALPAEKGAKLAAALNIGWKHELLLLGEPTERQANVEELIKREYAEWMAPEEGDHAPGNGAE